MTKRFKTKAKYENGLIKPTEHIDIPNGADIEIIVLTTDDSLTQEHDDTNTEELMKLAEKNPSFDFLNDPEEDIYTLNDLKIRYR